VLNKIVDIIIYEYIYE